MSIATVVTRGFGTFGSIPLVVTGGYSIGQAIVSNAKPLVKHSAGRSHVHIRDSVGGSHADIKNSVGNSHGIVKHSQGR